METLDDLDFHILRELIVGSGAYLRNDRVSLEAVARAVGVHRSTVADRIAKWSRIGFLTEWTIDVDPGALGLVGAHVHFDSKAKIRYARSVLRRPTASGAAAESVVNR